MPRSSTLSGVAGWSSTMASRGSLVLAVDGWSEDQGAGGRFKKTGSNSTDRGKQGVKRSLLTEAAGIPITVVIDGARGGVHPAYLSVEWC